MLGAGVDKVAEILHTSSKDAASKVQDFIESYPGLKLLKKERIPNDGQRGYFFGIDGRIVPVPSEHHVLAGYLQNGESVVMKTACLIWRKQLREDGIWFKQADFVHDEWQTRVKDNDEIARRVVEVQTNSIKQAGEILGLKCPLLGQGKQGYNWAETH